MLNYRNNIPNHVTPFVGLKAMEELANLEAERGNQDYLAEKSKGLPIRKGVEKQKGTRIASDEMCTFLILNISSLQLIPMNMIAYRSQYGSANPTAIVGPAIIATVISTVVAVAYCKIMNGKG